MKITGRRSTRLLRWMKIMGLWNCRQGSRFQREAQADKEKPMHVGGPHNPLSITIKSDSGSDSRNDALILYLEPRHPFSSDTDVKAMEDILRLWIRLLSLYAGTQPGSDREKLLNNLAEIEKNLVDPEGKASEIKGSNKKQEFLEQQFARLPDWIELRTAPKAPSGCQDMGSDCRNLGPLMRTRSALGVLKNLIELPGPQIEFVTPPTYQAIRKHPWNVDLTHDMSYYTLVKEDEDSLCEKIDEGKERGMCDNPDLTSDQRLLTEKISEWIKKHDEPGADLQTYRDYDSESDILTYKQVEAERRLAHFRRFILILEGDDLPPNAYVSYSYRGKWYYIDGLDDISKKNFTLLSTILTIMAVPSPSQALTPTISVGATK